MPFYRDVLGLSEAFAVGSERGARVVILEAGTATLEIVNPAQRRMSDEIEVGRQVSRTIRVAFEVGDATATTAELTAAGADLLAHPTRTPWDSLNSRLEAPAGLQITLFEELGDIESWPTIESDTRFAPCSAGRVPVLASLGCRFESVRWSRLSGKGS